MLGSIARRIPSMLNSSSEGSSGRRSWVVPEEVPPINGNERRKGEEEEAGGAGAGGGAGCFLLPSAAISSPVLPEYVRTSTGCDTSVEDRPPGGIVCR